MILFTLLLHLGCGWRNITQFRSPDSAAVLRIDEPRWLKNTGLRISLYAQNRNLVLYESKGDNAVYASEVAWTPTSVGVITCGQPELHLAADIHTMTPLPFAAVAEVIGRQLRTKHAIPESQKDAISWLCAQTVKTP